MTKLACLVMTIGHITIDFEIFKHLLCEIGIHQSETWT